MTINSSETRDNSLSPKINIEKLIEFLGYVGSEPEDMIYAGRTLYHYTDLWGVLGILGSHDLWLTHSRYSNDDEEFTHGRDIALEVIDNAIQAEGDTNSTRSDFLKSVRAGVAQPSQEGVYVCCFCTKGDLLSQWRGYAANGIGVSLEFDPSGFADYTGTDSPHGGLMRLWKVFYERNTKIRIIQSALDRGFFALNDAGARGESVAQEAVDAILFFLPTFKNPNFDEELECRLIFSPPPNCKIKPDFRVRRGMLVPHYSLRALGEYRSEKHVQLPVKSIRVGPSQNRRLNAESIQLFARMNGYPDLSVVISSTPYRG